MASAASPLSQQLAALLRDKRCRYVISGATVFLLNLAVFHSLMHYFSATALQRNLVNLAATEASYLYAYVAHASFTWSARSLSLKGLGLFHLVSGFGLILRTATFAALDAWGFAPTLALAASIGMQLGTNFLGYERFVFKLNTPRQP
jgi:putative flippase GtrA